METIKSILYWLTVGVLILYISLLVFSPNTMMDVFGFRAFIVLSNSMEPVINQNDLIVSKRAKEEELEVGDIITFHIYLEDIGTEGVVTHYIGAIEEINGTTIYKTKHTHQGEGIYDGWVDKDGNPIDVTFDDIEGEYVFKIPYLGYVKDIIQDKTFVFLVLTTGTIIYILIRVIRKELDEDEYEDE